MSQSSVVLEGYACHGAAAVENLPRMESLLGRPLGESAAPGRNVMNQQ